MYEEHGWPSSRLVSKIASCLLLLMMFIIVLICVFDDFEPYASLSLKSIWNNAELSVLLLLVVAESSQPAPI